MSHRLLLALSCLLLTSVSATFGQVSNESGPGARLMKFDSAKWRHDPEHTGHRRKMVSDLLQNYKLIGMKRQELYHLLGNPEESFHAYAAYSMYVPHSFHSCPYLVFAFKGDIVTKYREENRCPASSPGRFLQENWKEDYQKEKEKEKEQFDLWVDAPEESRKDAAEKWPFATPDIKSPSTVNLPALADDELLNKARELELKGDLEGARKGYAEFLKMYPKDPYAWGNLGKVDAETGHLNDAVRDFSKQIEVNGNSSLAYESRARIYMKLKKYDYAIKDYNQALEILQPKNAETGERTFLSIDLDGGGIAKAKCAIFHCSIGLAQLRLQRYKEALESLNEGIALFKSGGGIVLYPREIFLWRAQVHDALKQGDDAREDWKQAEMIPPMEKSWAVDIGGS